MPVNFKERIDHPWLSIVLSIGVLLLVVGLVLDLIGWQWMAAYFGIYGAIPLLASLIGYVVLGGLGIASRIQDRRYDRTP